MSLSQYNNARILFDLPRWIMQDEFIREQRHGEHTDGNIIEDALFNELHVEEVCLNHCVWCIVQFDCPPHALPDHIELFHQKLETLLKRFKRGMKQPVKAVY